MANRISVNGTELEYQLRGTGAGEPVVLIHWGVAATWAEPLLDQPALASRYQLLSYHRAGFAGSGRLQGPPTMASRIPRRAGPQQGTRHASRRASPAGRAILRAGMCGDHQGRRPRWNHDGRTWPLVPSRQENTMFAHLSHRGTPPQAVARPMRKLIVSLTASAIMAVGAVAGLQCATQVNALRSGSADHAVTRAVAGHMIPLPTGPCSGCHPMV